jgi:hypothetical protein
LIFCLIKDQVKWLSVCGPETCAIRIAVQNHRFQQLGAFRVVPLAEARTSKDAKHRLELLQRFQWDNLLVRRSDWNEQYPNSVSNKHMQNLKPNGSEQ